jgi:hypothetical protein
MDDPAPSYFRNLLSAFRYPLHGDGLYIIIGGAVIFTIADFVAAHASILGLLIELGVTGYVATYMKDVVRTSAMGEDTPPNWADFSDWMEDLLAPAIQMLVVMALTFGPTIFFDYKMPFDGVWQALAPFIAGVWGCITFPIIFLVVAMTDSVLAAFNPAPMLRAIGVATADYALTVLFCVLVLVVSTGIIWLEGFIRWIPFLPGFIGWLLNLLCISVFMRGIGLFYRCNHEKLEWY